ncbi:MAG: 2-amino-4-hydroxy-6-hydroxymethyldihydropteridine diphosphokinase [candidate division WOR-3 bacterium]|jgi:2-amino-4-hydroxy-6-hydroxymethyldihydropteridine diphosphokinase
MQKDMILLCLGSNIGDREKNISDAIKLIKLNNIKITGFSKLYNTEPVDYENQNDFLNIILKVSTDFSPDELLRVVKRIEYLIGRRESKIKKGPRIIDIDILFYNDIIINSEELTIPHKSVLDRYFIIKLLMDIDPEFLMPKFNIKVKDVYQKIDKSKRVEEYNMKSLKGVLF